MIYNSPPIGGKFRLDDLLWYGRLTGIMVWKRSLGRVKRGTIAGAWTKAAIYLRIDGKRYAAHHIAWLMHHGEWPSCEIDHRNGDPTDNSIDNLRLSDRVGQARNQRKKSIGSSSFKGVSRHCQHDGWVARIRTSSGRKSLGFFKDEREAALAYDAAARTHHGEFACLNFPSNGERTAR